MMAITYQLDIASSAVSANISDAVVDIGTHSLASDVNTAIFAEDSGSGADVWFSSDSGGTVPIAADLYYWSDGDSEFAAKVAAGSLSASTGGTIYLHVGGKPGGYDTDPYLAASLGRLPLASDFNDRTTNNLDGTGNGGIVAGSASTGPSGTIPATNFNHLDSEYISFGSNPLNAVSAYTVRGWFKLTSDTGGTLVIIGARDSSTDGVSIQLGANLIKGRHNSADADGTTTTNIALGWAHFAFTWDGSTTRIYVNGSEEDTAAVSTALSMTTNLAIGRAAYVASAYFRGDMANIGIDSSAASAAEINLDYLLEGSTASSYVTATEVTGNYTITGGILGGIIGRPLRGRM